MTSIFGIENKESRNREHNIAKFFQNKNLPKLERYYDWLHGRNFIKFDLNKNSVRKNIRKQTQYYEYFQ